MPNSKRIPKHSATSATSAKSRGVIPIDPHRFGLLAGNETPKDARTQKFCEYLARGWEVRQAAQEAGYSDSWAVKKAYACKRKYAGYISWLEAHIGTEIAKVIAVDQKAVFDEIARIGMSNEFDYIVIEDVEVEEKGAKRIVKRARRKHLHELTREQMSCIRVTGSGENLTYELLDKEGQLMTLAKMLGLLNEKVILEHRLGQAKGSDVDWSRVPLDKLEKMAQIYEAEFEEVGVSVEAR